MTDDTRSEDAQKMRKCLGLTYDELVLAIGKFAYDYANLGASEGDKETLFEFGKKWIDANKKALQDRICKSDQIEKIIRKVGDNDELSAGLIICDLVSSLLISIPPFFISALLMKIGIKKFCNIND
jgi:hypothetical protein